MDVHLHPHILQLTYEYPLSMWYVCSRCSLIILLLIVESGVQYGHPSFSWAYPCVEVGGVLGPLPTLPHPPVGGTEVLLARGVSGG